MGLFRKPYRIEYFLFRIRKESSIKKKPIMTSTSKKKIEDTMDILSASFPKCRYEIKARKYYK